MPHTESPVPGGDCRKARKTLFAQHLCQQRTHNSFYSRPGEQAKEPVLKAFLECLGSLSTYPSHKLPIAIKHLIKHSWQRNKRQGLPLSWAADCKGTLSACESHAPTSPCWGSPHGKNCMQVASRVRGGLQLPASKKPGPSVTEQPGNKFWLQPE